MKRLIVISSLVIVVILCFYWMSRKPKALYFARPFSSFGGLMGGAGLTIFENSTYKAWTYGCFGGLSAEGNYSLSNDTLYLSDLTSLVEGLEISNLNQDSLLAFESCDSLIHDQFNFVISSIDEPH